MCLTGPSQRLASQPNYVDVPLHQLSQNDDDDFRYASSPFPSPRPHSLSEQEVEEVGVEQEVEEEVDEERKVEVLLQTASGRQSGGDFHLVWRWGFGRLPWSVWR